MTATRDRGLSREFLPGRSVARSSGLGERVGRVAEAGRVRAISIVLWMALPLFLLPQSLSAQTARLAVPADSVSAGIPFDVSVAVTHAPGQQVTFPTVEGDPDTGPLLMLGDVEALSVRRLPPSIRGAARVDSAVFRVVTFAADSARLGPVVVQVDTGRVATGTALLSVRSVLSGPPPHEPAGFGAADTFPSATPLWIGLGALALVVVAGAVWALASVLRRPRGVVRQAPYPAARAHLATLARESPQTPAEVETHVVAVRDIVRGYLADRLGVPARRATTTEVLARLDGRIQPDALQAVRQSLVPTDLVAFAGVRPALQVVTQLRDHARAAIEAVEAEVKSQESADADPGSERPAAPHASGQRPTS